MTTSTRRGAGAHTRKCAALFPRYSAPIGARRVGRAAVIDGTLEPVEPAMVQLTVAGLMPHQIGRRRADQLSENRPPLAPSSRTPRTLRASTSGVNGFCR